MRIKEADAASERPAPRPRPTASKPAPRTARGGGSVAHQRAQSFRAATSQQHARRGAAVRLTKPDAATQRLLQLSTDPVTGQLKPGTGAVFVSFAKQLAERPGQAGANAYLHLANAGLPVADLGLKAQKNAGNVLKQLAARGADVGKLPKVSVLEPSERDAIRATLKKKGVDPGPDASDADVLAAIQKHKPRLSDIAFNVPGSAGKALLGLPMGAWGAGQATGALVFNHDPAALKRMGSGAVDYYRHIANHPLGALEQDPVGTVMAVMPAKTLIGGAAGRISRAGLVGAAAKDFASAPRKPLLLPKARSSDNPLEAPQAVSVLDQSPLSTNLIDRAIQQGASRLTAASPKLSRKKVETISRRHAAESKFAGYQIRNKALEPVQAAERKLSKYEKRAATVLAQGVTPRQTLEYYRIKLSERPGDPHLKGQVDFWDKVASKVPASNDKIDAYLEALRPALAVREASLQRVTTANEAMLQAREGIVRDEVLNTIRQHEAFVAAREPALVGVSGEPVAATAPRASSLADQPAPEPMYFPHVATPPKFGEFLSHKSMQPILKTQRQVSHQNNLVLFREGRWQPDLRHVHARIASAPLAEEMLNHLHDQMQFARPAIAGTRYDPNTTTLLRLHPDKIQSVKTDVSGEGLAQQIRDVKAVSHDDQAFLKQLEHQLIIPTSDGVVPEGVKAVLVPNEVMGQIKGTLARMQRNGFLRGMNTVTDIQRYLQLNIRGGYLTNNIFGNTSQTLISGAGPVSIARGFGHEFRDAVPAKLIGSGTTADLSKVQRLGGNAETRVGRALTGIGESAPARGIATAMDHNPITRWNIDYENAMRRAVYLHKAIPVAKKAVGLHRWNKVTDDVMEYLKNNEVPQATQAVTDFLGDMRKQARHPNFRILVPYYRWIGFITKLSLATLPLKYPVRNALIQELGRQGNQQLAAMGLVPKYLQGNIPVDAHRDQHGHVLANMLSTQGLNPFASIGQTYGMGVQGAANSLNPSLTTIADAAYGRNLGAGFDLRDQNGKIIDISRAGEPVFWQALIAQELRNVPLVNLFSPPQHTTAESIPIPGLESPLKQPKGLQQPRMPGWRNAVAYLIGVRVKPTDLTLYNLQSAYNLIQASNLSKEQKKAARHRFNVEMGKAKGTISGPEGPAGTPSATGTYQAPTYTPASGYTTPTYSVP